MREKPQGEQGVSPASLTPHRVEVTYQVGPKDAPVVMQDTYEHIVAKMQSPAGVVLINQAGETVAFYPYDHLLKVVSPGLDTPKSQLTLVPAMPLPFPGIQ